jgi:hypothetical protein
MLGVMHLINAANSTGEDDDKYCDHLEAMLMEFRTMINNRIHEERTNGEPNNR